MAKINNVMPTDIVVTSAGSVSLLEPRTDAARAWLRENADSELRWWFGALVVEHYYATGIVTAAREAGLVVSHVVVKGDQVMRSRRPTRDVNDCPRCGEPLKIRVVADFCGDRFGRDGFAFDDLELGDNEATVYCASAACAYEVPFGTWQTTVGDR